MIARLHQLLLRKQKEPERTEVMENRPIFVKKPTENQVFFEAVLDIAQQARQHDPETLVFLIRFLAEALQRRLFFQTLYQECRQLGPVELHRRWLLDPSTPLTADGKTLYDLRIEITEPREIVLGEDVVFTQPWKRERLVKALSEIGVRKKNKWQQSKQQIELWEPIGVSWVRSGHHSISAGVIQREGTIRPYKVYNISPVYQHVRCDGECFYRVYDNAIIRYIDEIEFAAIFEIGRLLASEA
jgi:hypothetical protein